jgi:hypothetical protein
MIKVDLFQFQTPTLFHFNLKNLVQDKKYH